MRSTARWYWLVLLGVLACPRSAAAQAASQLWANGIVNWFATDLLLLQVDAEPKSNPLDVDVTPRVQYTLAPWIDVLAELDIGHTADEDTTATPRVGVELHILSRLLDRRATRDADREKPPRRRLVVSTLLRVEDDQSTWRLRDRFALAYALNRHKTTDDGAIYLSADNELFIPLDRAPGEALVTKMRFRGGVGYRESFPWRYELFYIWNGTRTAAGAPLAQQSHAIDIRVIRAF